MEQCLALLAAATARHKQPRVCIKVCDSQSCWPCNHVSNVAYVLHLLFLFTIQASAIDSTRALVASSLPSPASPNLHLHQSCHSQLQALVGSNTAALVAFNLGYLPGGDKGLITTTDSTTAAVEAALEVGGMVTFAGRGYATQQALDYSARHIHTVLTGTIWP
jgi:hypothetical protein